MIDIYLKHDNIHKNEMFYALIWIINLIIFYIIWMLSLYLSRCEDKKENVMGHENW